VSVRWGLMSTARINTKFLAGARLSDKLEVVAVASRNSERASRYASEQEIERSYGSYQDLLDDPELDAVYVSLPNSLHLEWTEKALLAGKHVLCEKPLGRRAADVEAIFDVAARADRLLMEAFMYRHHPQTARVIELVDSGAIGDLKLVRGAFSFKLEDDGDVRLSSELGGGALMDVGCYCVNAARLLAGEPEAVRGHQTLGGDGVDVAFTGSMRFSEDRLAHFDAGIDLAPRDELEVVGDRASLFLDDPWHCREPVIELRAQDGLQRIEIDPVNPYLLEAENFSAAIRGEAAPLLGRADAVGQARAIGALYDSAGLGSSIGGMR
jgi:xylose dehydrogenase (NAD/NADP)